MAHVRILTCLTHDHNALLVLLAGLVCIFGSSVTVRLSHRAIFTRGSAGLHWLLLASVCAGFSIWATHFIAMLGYRPGVPVNFDPTLTIISALIAIAGTAAGIFFAQLQDGKLAALFGGGMIGLTISAMHYVGMFAYRPDGIVSWHPVYVAVSVICAMALSSVALHRLLSKGRELQGQVWDATFLLVGAILLLHFTGMAAFEVTPIEGFSRGGDSEVFTTMAAAIAVATMMIIGTGISTHLVEEGRVDAQRRLRHIALHDMLTGLSNRHSFVTQLADECTKLSLTAQPFALLMIDLDHFKAVNDTMGHPIGDLLLESVAKRLQNVARGDDVIARIGGDEFAMMARDVADREDAERLAGKIVEVLSSPFKLEGYLVEIGASVGVTLAPSDSEDAETLTQQADVALYRAKREGRGRVCVFDPSLTDEMLERCALESELRQAFAGNNFELLYQPIFDARSRRLTGAEALLRWNSVMRGEVPPDVFIPIAEEIGLITAIGETVLERACALAVNWPEELSVSVNVSPVQIMSGHFVRSVEDALSRSGLAAHRLKIEITENSLLCENEIVLRTLQDLRALGLGVSLDDFGKGYSSLGYLHRFPIDQIKIDRSFIARLPEDASSASIVRTICQLGASLGIDVTAEGIENLAQASFVAGHGCTHMQGFFLSKPLDENTTKRLFAADSEASSSRDLTGAGSTISRFANQMG